MAMRHAVRDAEAELSRKLVERRAELLIWIGPLAVALGNCCILAIVIDFDADRYDRRFDLRDEVGEALRSLSRFGRPCRCNPCRQIECPVIARPDDENAHAEASNRSQQREAPRLEEFSWRAM